jgi:small conductance mechanosensitive channel
MTNPVALVHTLAMKQWLEKFRDLITAHAAAIALNVLIAIVVFVLGRWIARALVRVVIRFMELRDVEVSLRKFLGDLLYAAAMAAVITAALSAAGVQTTAVVAILGAASLAVGLALQGSLSNFAAGVMLIILRPYKVGDQVLIGKHRGRVDAIKVFQTVLVTDDNREVTIPNGQIITQPIENYTARGTRRFDIAIMVPHSVDLHAICSRIEAVFVGDERVARSPACAVAAADIKPDGITLVARSWVASESYSAVTSDAVARVRQALRGETFVATVEVVAS